MAKRLEGVTRLKIADIEVSGRLRPASEAGVAALVTSYAEVGPLHPVHVRKMPKQRWRLMTGLHRLTAHREMGWDEIDVVAWQCNDAYATMMEIDDNLAGSELSILDTAVFLAARKETYETLHPETKATTGADLAAKRWDASDSVSLASFTATTAEKIGKSKRQVERLVRAGFAVRGHAHQLRKAPRPVSLADMMQIAKIDEVTERYFVIEQLETGAAPSAAVARKKFGSQNGKERAPLDATDAAFSRLLDAWTRAPKAARRRFIEERGGEVQQLLDDMTGVSDLGDAA
ncbi:chromosome partitioning protein ParB [Sagittula sp. P11]|uniref:ParB/RepB/Spo0J family partition protein n=1 Tax=Sagittula sp. P11 TaxID=2009329 RepID=UPI000C2D4494|nr:ParB/RepB/Spo0J family partition protein [Sagittula sp. P11]AUC54270.1 chromosome partitioning protein ParB [Sagittula sp. P11]